jgi:mono/diheme cytochrome c family protein
MSPAIWPLATYENAWKQWGLKEKPADYDLAFRERYGLHAAPYDNDRLPMGLHTADGPLGKGIVNDCLLCHAGSIAGETYIGLGNASLDLEELFEELTAASIKFEFPFRFSSVRGVIDPVNPTSFLMAFRDDDLNLRAPIKVEYTPALSSDPPAWWLLKKKKIRNWTGSVAVESMRVDMVNLLSPLNGPDHIKKHEPVFAAIHAFVLSVQPPKYPFPVDEALATRGRGVFEKTCARCHGTYGQDWSYPNKVVSLDVLGTDRRLAEAVSRETLETYNKSWFGQEKGPDAKPLQAVSRGGYQAPPLDGVWATAPYFHNGSVPTVYDVLNSKSRPAIYTRSYRTGKEDYDPTKLGWKITVLEKAPGADVPGIDRRKVYDTTQHGQSNAGHRFGDALSEDDRNAVIEYLKTL